MTSLIHYKTSATDAFEEYFLLKKLLLLKKETGKMDLPISQQSHYMSSF